MQAEKAKESADEAFKTITSTARKEVGLMLQGSLVPVRALAS